MSENNEDLLEFLRQQVLWCQQQDAILEEIENKLYQMKELAIYRRSHDLTDAQVQQVNKEMQQLEAEIHLLEQRLSEKVLH